MFKNMIRKSLALGSGLALAATGLVASPAQATATGLLWSAYGQTNEMVGVANHDFTLRISSPAALVTPGPTATEVASTTNQANDDAADAAAVAALSAAGLTADVNAVLDALAAKVFVTWVPAGGKTAPTISVTANDTATAATPAANTVSAVLVTSTSTSDVFSSRSGDDTGGNTDSGVTVTRTTTSVATGNIVLTAPTSLDYNMQVDVYVVYGDGSRSETERITFLPKDDVSTSVSVAPVAVSVSSLKSGNSFSFTGINTGNFIQSNSQGTNPGANGNATSADFGTYVTVGGTAATTSAWAYDVLTDSYTFGYTDAIVAGDVIIAKVNLWSGSATIDANKYFDATADDTEGKYTVSATGAYAAMDIVAATSASVVQNTGTATSTVSAETVVAAEGTKTLNFTIQLFTDSAMTTAAGANNPVTVTLTDTSNGLKTTTITSEGKSLDVTGTSISFTKVSNSSGQISFTVAADKAVDGESFTITATGSLASISIQSTTVKWQEAAWTLLPAVDGNFTIAPKGSISVDYTVVNQFGALADADYQLTFTRAAGAGARDTAAEYANWSYVAPVSATGRASVTIVDNGAAATEGSDTVTVALQKKATSGTGYIAVAGSTDTFTLKYENDLASTKLTALTNYNGIANAAGTALEPLKLETKTLVDYDSRLAGVKPVFNTDGASTSGNVPTSAAGVTPVTYTTGMLRVYGTVRTAANVGVAGVAVKISGTGANFANASTIASATLMKNDSLVVFTDATGSYEAFVRSSVAGTQTISIDAQGVTDSVQVRFQDSTGVAATMTLSVPSGLTPGARADVVAKVVDKFGKPVTGVTVNFKDNGPGVLNAATATTDIFGEAQVTLTTVAAESGTNTITAFATLSGVTTVRTATITVGATAAAAADAKVNAGSFKGYVALYAKGYAGQRMSAKVGNDWVVVPVLASNFERVVEFTGVGYAISVRIYIDGELKATIPLVTR